MNRVLIIGINGGFGSHVAREMLRRGWRVRAMSRHPEKLPHGCDQAEVVQGDAAEIAQIRHAAAGMDMIVYAASPANYDWKNKALPWLENTVRVAEENRQTLLFPGNVYVFNPSTGPDFDESALAEPLTEKGEIRRAMEDRLCLAAENGARVIILRCGDFIAADAPSTWLSHLIKTGRNRVTISAAGPAGLSHTWAYLPDVAQTVVELAIRRDSLPAYAVFHFRGHRFSFADLAETVKAATGKKVVLTRFPWTVIKLLAPFSIMFRGLLEMRYLWDQELNLVDASLRDTLGKPVPHTPLAQALTQTGLLGVA